MGISRLRQDQIWTEGAAIADNLNPPDHDANAVDLADSIDYICSQLTKLTGEVAWETAPDMTIAAMAAKTWLDDKKALRDKLLLTDVPVPNVVTGTGDDFTKSGSNVTLTDSAGSFTADMVGRSITITLATTPGNNGTFTITSYTDSQNITYVNASGATEAFTGNWSVDGANWVVLKASASETPTRNIAIVSTTSGAVSAQLASGHFNSNRLTEVVGDNALNPQNLCIIFDATSGDPIKSSERQVYALLQVEDGASDGVAFDDSSNQGQLSFVRPNATYDDLEACPIADIRGKSINYVYADRETLSLWSAQDFRRSAVLVDLASPGVTQTLDIAYDGGSQVNVDNTNVDWRLTDTKHFYISDDDGSDRILDVAAQALGDTIGIRAPGGITINSGDVLSSTGKATFNSVEIGGVAGQVKSLGVTDLALIGADDITFTTVRQAALPLDDATVGPISGLEGGPHASIAAAINYAIQHGMDFTLSVVLLGSNYARDANVPGAISPISLSSPHSIDMNTVSGVDTFVFLNGRLLWGGNGTTNNDVYVGNNAAAGDLKFDFPAGVKSGDLIIGLQLSAS